MISFTTTCTLRPNIMRDTFESFNRNLIGTKLSEHDLYLNIDPSPKNSCDPNEMLQVAQKYFKKVIYNIPKQPNFCAAVKWLWETATGQYVFHLEDDWKLIYHVNLNKLINLLSNNPKVNQIRLRKPAKRKTLLLYGLSPCLIKGDFCRSMSKILDININPERQLRPFSRDVNNKFTHVIVYPKYIATVDIGQTWRASRYIKKPANENNFIKWI